MNLLKRIALFQEEVLSMKRRVIFLQAANEGRKLEALLITESGKSNQALLGIVTHWDLAKFD